MGPSEVVEALPLGELLVQIYIVDVVEMLVELLLIGAVRAHDFTVQLRRTWLDVDVPNAFVFDTPVKLSLELVPPVSPDTLHTKRERFQYMIDECDRVLLRVVRIDLQGPDCGSRRQSPCIDTVSPVDHPCGTGLRT